ncbi:hypothetical protein NDU88_002540 [Pleurodeles waltl]|uniref:Uncharacterized protein n=1 Tax=Pleurodeles waltl TaxID=8319 RepID=A0AAV7Q6C2_PLEWA|nr:hypothetical protein NDU88_002540 [Pleurodeles waltl]
MVVGPLLPLGGPNHQTRRGGTPESHLGPPGTSLGNPSSGSPKGTRSGTPSGSGDTPARASSPHTLGARRPGSVSTTAPARLLDPTAGVGGYVLTALRPCGPIGVQGILSPSGVSFSSAWAPAQPSPPSSPRTLGVPLTSIRDPGGPAAGDAPPAAPSLPGPIPGGPLFGAARTPRLPQPAPPGRDAGQPRPPGALLAGRGSAATPIHRAPRPGAQRQLPPNLYGASGPRQTHQGAGSSESASSRRPGSDGHFDTRAAACVRGSASPPLTTAGSQRDGETAGTVGTAPLGR